MYKVVKAFHDLQDPGKDGYHYYKVGDEYPHTGMKVSPERIEELSGAFNAQKCPLIRKVRTAAKK